MKIQILCAVVAVLALAGCNKAEKPAEVQADVAAAREDAQQSVASVQSEAAVEQGKLDYKSAENAADVAVARAEADYKVAVQLCEAMSGDQQKACKAKAEAARDMVKANVQTATAAVEPK